MCKPLRIKVAVTVLLPALYTAYIFEALNGVEKSSFCSSAADVPAKVYNKHTGNNDLNV
jgi:hypothetical protein